MNQHLNLLVYGKAAGGQARVRTTFGKSDRVGSQGGLRKRGLWRRLNGHGKRKRRNSQADTYGQARRISIPTAVYNSTARCAQDPKNAKKDIMTAGCRRSQFPCTN